MPVVIGNAYDGLRSRRAPIRKRPPSWGQGDGRSGRAVALVRGSGVMERPGAVECSAAVERSAQSPVTRRGRFRGLASRSSAGSRASGTDW